MLQAGDQIGPLRIERPLGAGGMGEVYLALDERLERRVAVKLLPDSRSLDPGARGRMLREARAASALKHPNIVTVHDIGEHGDLVYIVMEYVDGETFEDMVVRRGRLAPAAAVALFAELGDAVAAAHAAGVLHRDLKSANLMLDGNGRVKVLDFGLSKRTLSHDPSDETADDADEDGAPVAAVAPTEDASGDALGLAPTIAPSSGITVDASVVPPSRRLSRNSFGESPTRRSRSSFGEDFQTVHGARMGTPGWAAPELTEGRPADVRTDVFALGCVLYHLLAGRPPFAGATWATQGQHIAAGPAPLTDVPPALAAVVRAALSPSPADRHRDVPAMVAAARAAIAPRHRGTAIVAVGGAAALASIAIALKVLPANERSTSNGAVPDDASTAVAPPPAPPRQLTQLQGCAYSPTFLDEDTVVFDLTKDGAVDLYRLDLEAKTPSRLTRDPGWEWRSSRGASATEIVFPTQSKDQVGIHALDVTSGTRRTLATVTGAVAFAGGAYYYAATNTNVLRRRTGDRDEELLQLPPARGIDTLVAAHDGSRLALVMIGERGGLPELCTIALDRPALDCLTVPTSTARPAFSARNDAVYYHALGGIWRQSLAGGPPVRALLDASAIGGIAVSPRGTSLVYSDCTSRTLLADVIDDPRRSIIDDTEVAAPDYGPAGVFAYLRADLGQPAIFLRERDGVVRQIYTRKNARLSDLELAPDGCCVAFVMSEAGQGGIYLASTSSSAAPNRLTEHTGDQRPVFAGDHILFTRLGADGSPRLMRVARDGSGLAQLGTRPRVTVDAAADRVLVASPALDYLYWWDVRTGRERPGPKLPTSTVTSVALSPDGRWILVLAGSHEIWRLRSDGSRAPELVRTLPEDLSAISGAIDDRGHPLIAVDTWAGELWLVSAPAGFPW